MASTKPADISGNTIALLPLTIDGNIPLPPKGPLLPEITQFLRVQRGGEGGLDGFGNLAIEVNIHDRNSAVIYLSLFGDRIDTRGISALKIYVPSRLFWAFSGVLRTHEIELPLTDCRRSAGWKKNLLEVWKKFANMFGFQVYFQPGTGGLGRKTVLV